MATRTPAGSDTKQLFRLATSPAKSEDLNGSLDDLMNTLKKVKAQDRLRGTWQALQDKSGQHDVIRTLQQRIEQVKEEVDKLGEEHQEQKRESRELDAQIAELEEELDNLKKEKGIDLPRSRARARGGWTSCRFLVQLALVFLLVWLAVEVVLWQTGRDDFLPEFYHAHFRALINHHWSTNTLPTRQQ